MHSLFLLARRIAERQVGRQARQVMPLAGNPSHLLRRQAATRFAQPEASKEANGRKRSEVVGRKATDFPLFVYNYFVLQNDCDWALDNLRIEPVMPPDDERPFITMLELYHASFRGGLWGALAYNAALFSDEATTTFVGEYRRVLETILSCADDNMSIAGFIGR
jgi:hypothetical protein